MKFSSIKKNKKNKIPKKSEKDFIIEYFMEQLKKDIDDAEWYRKSLSKLNARILSMRKVLEKLRKIK